MCGVTLATYRKTYGANKTVADLKKIPYEEWKHIMKTQYWDKVLGDRIDNQSVAEIMADWCVNSGTKVIKNIQRLVGVKDDGIVGNQTIAAINAQCPMCLHKKIADARRQYYDDIIKRNPSQEKFRKGWFSRIDKLEFFA